MKFATLALTALMFSTVAVTATLAQRKTSAKPAAAAMTASSLDGKWTGKTLQNQPVRFTVERGRITEFTIAGRFVGPGCSSVSTTTLQLDRMISNKAFAYNSISGPGGVSVNINGVFTGASTVRGSALMELHAIPGPPPGVPGHVPSCGAVTSTKWAAVKGDVPPDDIRAILSPAATKKSVGPNAVSLLAPKENEILDNGCSNLVEPLNWGFQWAPVTGATRYHLYVIHETATKPIVDDQALTEARYAYVSKGMIPTENLDGWLWKVRPMVKGIWKPWSEERRFNVEATDMDCLQWSSDLLKAVDGGDMTRVDALLATDWVVEVQRSNKGYGLMRPDFAPAFRKAVEKGNIAVVRKLMDAGASVIGSFNSDKSYLTYAIESGNTELAKLLIEKGADTGYSRKAPIVLASETGQPEIVRLLIQRGASVTDPFDNPLVAAVKKGHIEVVRVLLEARADPNQREFGGRPVLSIARELGFKEIEALLVKHGARSSYY